MKRVILNITKYIRNVLIAVGIIGTIIFILCKAKNYNLSNAFLYAGIGSMVVGLLSLYGNSRISSQNEVTSNYRTNKNDRDNCFNFLIFMGIVGAILILISITFNN